MSQMSSGNGEPNATALRRAAVYVCALTLLSAPLVVSRGQTPRDSSVRKTDSSKTTEKPRGYPPGIQDNSFLVEEAYNQDPGVVQHISGFQHEARGAPYAYQFTQEWPVGGIANQLSYSFSIVRPDALTRAGLGDVRLNYRYQLVGDGEAVVAVAPRLTVILPTGDYRRNRGVGASGAEIWLPASWVLSDQFVVHGNLGATVVPNARNSGGDQAATTDWTASASAIWLFRPNFNFLIETLYQNAADVIGPRQIARASTLTVSPGVRWAYNYSSGLQIVPGVALPLGVGGRHAPTALFFYLSFEHPFTAAARAKAAADKQ